jgi:hypothetical protein
VFLDSAVAKAGIVDAISAWVFPLSLIQSVPVGSGPGLGSYSGGPYVANLCSLPVVDPVTSIILQAGNC